MRPRIELEIVSGRESGTICARATPAARSGNEGSSEGPLREVAEEALGVLARNRRVRVDVLLRQSLVQVRTLEGLPPVREPDLVKLTGAQHERFFRPIPGTPCTAAIWHTADDGQRVVRAALAELEFLVEIERSLQAVGASADRFLVSADPSEGPRLSLQTPSMVDRGARAERRQWIAIAAVALTGWAVPGAAYVGDLAFDYRALRVEAADVGTTLDRIDSLEARLVEFNTISAILREGDSRWATESLAILARELPEGVHLHSLSLDHQGNVRLTTHPEYVEATRTALETGWQGPDPVVEEDS